MSWLVLGALLALGPARPPASGAVADLERGHRLFRAGDFAAAARALEAVPARLPRTKDYALHLLAESEFYAGNFGRAGVLFTALAGQRTSRFAAVAPWRAADCAWADGKHAAAVAAYRKLLRKPPAGVDPVVARFRVAELASGDEARSLFRQIHVESPAHPLAARAAERAGVAVEAAPTAPATPPTPRERLRRATALADGKHYQEAIAELERLPDAELAPELRAERDFELGMARYHMRREYPRAAALLLAAEAHLPGDKAAFAAFHGARSLSRADHDDQAIAAYGHVVARYPASRWAAEAQFRAGWVDFNRGRYRESIPALRATLARFAHSPFGNDAAWFLMLANFLLDQGNEALAALGEYARLSGMDAGAARRAQYFRARILDKLGRKDEARAALQDCVRRAPFGYYGLVAAARLRAAGETVAPPLPAADVRLPPARAAADNPMLARADELLRAGLVVEAGQELQRGEDALSARLGRDAALALLLERYPKMQGFHRAFQLAETRGAAALAAAPTGAARRLWEAAYPRAFSDLVDRYGPAQGNPDFFLYAIMREESAFSPNVLSPADARGLLQVIPDVGQQIAKRDHFEFHEDELYDPETNVRIGSAYIGALARRFRGQVPLAAGAYNAGPRPVMRWCDLYGQRPLDEFMELVAYETTREYMKLVTGFYARYVYLYTGKMYELPLQVNAAYEKD